MSPTGPAPTMRTWVSCTRSYLGSGEVRSSARSARAMHTSDAPDLTHKVVVGEGGGWHEASRYQIWSRAFDARAPDLDDGRDQAGRAHRDPRTRAALSRRSRRVFRTTSSTSTGFTGSPRATRCSSASRTQGAIAYTLIVGMHAPAYKNDAYAWFCPNCGAELAAGEFPDQTLRHDGVLGRRDRSARARLTPAFRVAYVQSCGARASAGVRVRRAGRLARRSGRTGGVVMTEPLHLRMMGSGNNWMNVSGIIAVAINSYYSPLPPGSLVSVTTMDPGVGSMDGPKMVGEGQFDVGMTTPGWYGRLALEGQRAVHARLPAARASRSFRTTTAWRSWCARARASRAFARSSKNRFRCATRSRSWKVRIRRSGAPIRSSPNTAFRAPTSTAGAARG